MPLPDGTATFETMYHQMEIECKKKQEETGSGTGGDGWERRCHQEYGSALYMTAEEKQVSFYNRYFIFRKNRKINAKQLKNSFLSYAGLQEEQQRMSLSDMTDEAMEHLALEKIAKASRPIDVASKPAIAANIVERQRENVTAAAAVSEIGEPKNTSGATTQKNKPKLKKVTTLKATAASGEGAAAISAVPPPHPADEEPEAPSAPIEQLEKKIKKRTKKAPISDVDAEANTEDTGAAAAKPKAKRQTKKKTDL